MQRCVELYFDPAAFLAGPIQVVEVGSADVNGSYRQLFSSMNVEYVGVDLEAGSGVDLVADDPYSLPLESESADIVLSGQTLEHSEFFWRAFAEMARILRADGFLFLIVPSAGPIHRFPVDCYRFYPDALPAIARYAGLQLIESWYDDRGPWNDVVGVFAKSQTEPSRRPCPVSRSLQPRWEDHAPSNDPRVERRSGGVPCLDVLRTLHDEIKPDLYLEIGVRYGASLRLAKSRSVGVDPWPAIKVTLSDLATIYPLTSDWFFESEAHTALSGVPGLVFLDGMHLIEFLLRDFINVEKFSDERTILVIDDIFPCDPAQAARNRESQVWTGDVWKILPCLREYRPDLRLLPIDASPNGILLVQGLDSSNTVLSDRYNPIVRSLVEMDPVPPESVMARHGATVVAPSRDISDLLSEVRRWASGRESKDAGTLADKRSSNPASNSAGATKGCGLSTEVLGNIQEGVLRTRYRGVPFLKSPFDISLYLQLIGDLMPKTVIEIGTLAGGSALWFADMLSCHGVEVPRVISIDIDPAPEVEDHRISFLQGAARALGECLGPELLAGLSRPLLAVEDSSHLYPDVLAAMRFFDGILEPGDYLVVEDGVVDQLPGAVYAAYENGPNRAVRDFLRERGADYEIDVARCDQFGTNVTYNPNGWLRRIGARRSSPLAPGSQRVILS